MDYPHVTDVDFLSEIQSESLNLRYDTCQFLQKYAWERLIIAE